MLRAGSGSASSLVRSMKNARDDPQASENTDTMTPTIIDGGNLPGKLLRTSLIKMGYQGHVSGVKALEIWKIRNTSYRRSIIQEDPTDLSRARPLWRYEQVGRNIKAIDEASASDNKIQIV